MGLIIDDGEGKGVQAGVTTDNRLYISARTMKRAAYQSRDTQQTFSWQNLTYDYAAADTILLVKNTNTKDLLIDSIEVSGSTATQVVIHMPDCTTPTGTVVTGVNLNRTSGRVAVATAKANETTNAISNVVTRQFMIANTRMRFDIGGSIILGQNQCVAVDFVTDGTAALVTIIGWFE